MADAARFSCEGCGKTYGWKQELAGRKVKCKCGHVMVVPHTPPAPEDEGLFELAPEDPQPKPAIRRQPTVHQQHASSGSIVGATAIGLTVIPAAVRGSSKKPGGGHRGGSGGSSAAAGSGSGRTLAYAPGPSQRDRERRSTANTVDTVRDVHAPVALLVIGFIAYLAYYMLRANVSGGGLALISLGLGGMMIGKAALMMVFALVVAGPLGVSFGGIYTAALKLAAIAIFSDGLITWVDFGVDKMTGMRGMFGSMISFPIALGVFWVLLIYLFSMDPGDSWMVVILLCVFDYIIRMILLMVLLTIIFKMGGGTMAGLGSIAAMGGAGPPMLTPAQSGAPTVASEDADLAEHLAKAKETGFLLEAREYIAGGRQSILKQHTEDWYAAGAKNCWFEVVKDINQKTTPTTYYVELPVGKEKRAKCFEILKAYYKALGDAVDDEDLKDTGSKYIQFGVP